MSSFLFRLRYVLPLIRRYKVRFFLGFLLLIGTTFCGAAIPWLIKETIDGLKEGDENILSYFPFVIIGVALFQGFLRVSSRVMIYGVGRKIEYELRRRLYHHLLQLPVSFFDTHKSGDILSRSTNDITNIRLFIGPGFLQLASVFITYCTVVPVMMSLDLELALWAMLPYPLLFITMKVMMGKMFKAGLSVQTEFGNMSSFVHESVTGIHVIKSFHNEKREKERFGRIVETYYEKAVKQAQIQSLTFPLMGMVGGLSAFIILWVGGHHALRDEISVGDYAAFSGYLLMLIWPTIGFGWVMNIIQRGLAALERVNSVLDEAEETIKKEASARRKRHLKEFVLEREKSGERGSIRFEKVSFRYHSDGEWVLRDIDLQIKAGEWVVITGPVSSGKSTLLSLLPALYSVTEGRILFDGVDASVLPLRQLRESVSFVRQESFLFSESLRTNILFGVKEKEEEKRTRVMQESAKLASVYDDIIGFQQGFDTIVGERGVILSGGQRQRTSIARGTAVEPRILLLDDCFSSVDVSTEKKVVEGIQSLKRRKTIIMTTQRLTSISGADRIYVLEKGRIVQSGNHHELMNQEGFYKRNYDRQKLEEEINQYD